MDYNPVSTSQEDLDKFDATQKRSMIRVNDQLNGDIMD